MSRFSLVLLACGVLLGAAVTSLLVGSDARAQAGFAECAVLTIPNASNGADLAGRAPEHPIRVPSGWTPVGGGTYRDRVVAVVVCH